MDRSSKFKYQNVLKNVSKEEIKSIDNLKKDDSIMILPADKRRVTVVMNKKEYEDKCQQQSLLYNHETAWCNKNTNLGLTMGSYDRV